MVKTEEEPYIFVIRHPKFGFLTHSYDGCGGPQLEFTHWPKDKEKRHNTLLHPEWFPTRALALEHLKWIKLNQDSTDISLEECVVFKLYQDIYAQNRVAYKQYEANRLVNPT